MKKEQFIQELYNRTVDDFLQNVDNDWELLASSYKDYLNKVYEYVEINSENYIKALDIFSQSQSERWKDASEEDKMRELVRDEAFSLIGELSQKGFILALDKKWHNTTFDKTEATKAINSLKENLNKVKQFNKELARILVSEGILDYNFASDINDKMSLRMGRSGNLSVS